MGSSFEAGVAQGHGSLTVSIWLILKFASRDIILVLMAIARYSF
jgi:hypothetical protein